MLSAKLAEEKTNREKVENAYKKKTKYFEDRERSTKEQYILEETEREMAFDEMKAQMDDIAKQLESANREHAAVKEHLQAQIQQLEFKNKDYVLYHEKYEEMKETELDSITNELESLMKENDALKEEITMSNENAEKVLDQLYKSLEEKVVKLEEDLDTEKLTNDRLKTKIISLEKNEQNLKNTITVLRDEVKCERMGKLQRNTEKSQKIETEMEKMATEILELKRQKSELEKRQKAKDDESGSKDRQIQNLTSNLESMSNIRNVLNGKIEILGKEMNIATESNSVLKKAMDVTNNHNVELESFCKSLERTNKELQEELHAENTFRANMEKFTRESSGSLLPSETQEDVSVEDEVIISKSM